MESCPGYEHLQRAPRLPRCEHCDRPDPNGLIEEIARLRAALNAILTTPGIVGGKSAEIVKALDATSRPLLSCECLPAIVCPSHQSPDAACEADARALLAELAEVDHYADRLRIIKQALRRPPDAGTVSELTCLHEIPLSRRCRNCDEKMGDCGVPADYGWRFVQGIAALTERAG